MEPEAYLITFLNSSEVMYYLFFQSVEIRCQENNDNPNLFSAYAINIDGTSTRIAEASRSKLQDLRDLANKLATKFWWDFNDHTQLKDYSHLNCPKCGNETEVLHDGYCEDCSIEGQRNLNDHIARHDAWGKLSDQEKDSSIRSAARVF